MRPQLQFRILPALILAMTGMTALPASAQTCDGIVCTIVGTSSGETLTGTSGADVICGLAGNDTINAGEAMTSSAPAPATTPSTARQTTT